MTMGKVIFGLRLTDAMQDFTFWSQRRSVRTPKARTLSITKGARKRKGGCNKSSENKNTLEFTVANAVYEFLSRRENAEIVAQDTINYYEQRTGEDSLRSIEARIRHAQDEAEQLTNAFILARNDMLRANIEKKMQEIEILIKDLSASKAQIELERGKKFTKEKIVDFIAEMMQGNPADKEYQKQLIDNLVYKVFVYDDHIVPNYFPNITKREKFCEFLPF